MLHGPRLGPGRALEGARLRLQGPGARRTSAARKGTPGSRAAAEGNRGRAGRAWEVSRSCARGPGLPGVRAPRGGVGVASRLRATRQASRSRSLCLPGLRVSVECACAPGASSLVTGCQLSGPPASPSPEGTPPGLLGSFAKLEGKGRGRTAPPPQTPGSALKLVLQVQRPFLPRSSLARPGLGRREHPTGSALGLGIFSPQLGGCPPAQKPPGPVGVGAQCSQAFRAGGGRGGSRVAGGPRGELSGCGTEPGCPCDCGVLWKRKL